ncbi:MAG: PEP-CTERM sorting domain-containing protein [Azoarcus sp.]|jgi:hypothetical protein|nr:PEP-CTERM sorting domain-containing protein [Azoarcus sp.]
MSKLLAALMLALGSVSALAAPDTVFKEWVNATGNGLVTVPPPPSGSVESVMGGDFYIVDPDAPVEFSFVTSHAGHTLDLFVGSPGSSGDVGSWQHVFTKTGNSVGASAVYEIDPRSFSYTSGGSELVFKLYDKTTNKTYYSGLGSANPDGAIHTVSYYEYYEGSTLVGFEDLDAGVSDWDYDDLVFLVSNVARVPVPSVPEPETYAMLLAGIGLLGAVARRRRTRA